MALTKTTKQKKIKVAHTRLPQLIPVLGSQPAGDVSHKPGGIGCHYFPSGPQLPPQPLIGLVPISLLGEQRHDGCDEFARDFYRQRRGCDLNRGPTAPESSTPTTPLPSNPKYGY